MARYYVNKNAQSTGEHEVHKLGCDRMPNEDNRVYLGDFPSCRLAIQEARKYYKSVDGCKHCSPACHTR